MNLVTDPPDWVTYWDTLAEGRLLFREEALQYVRNLVEALPVDAGMRVLDFGCGYGFVAEELAPRVAELYLWDAAESMRRHAHARLAGQANVHAVDLSNSGVGQPSDELRFDLILVNSIIQYMQENEFVTWLDQWGKRLAPGGRLVVSDIIPPNQNSLAAMRALLVFSLRRGYLLRALRNVVRERRRYQAMTQSCPLYHVGPERLSRHAEAAGLAVRFLPRNLTHFTGRITAVFSNRPNVTSRAATGDFLAGGVS